MRRRPHLVDQEDLPPAPLQQRSTAKRRRIMDAALAVFADRGYEQASLEDIATLADVAVGGIYQHFRSKRQLLLVLIDELVERLATVELRLEETSHPKAGIRILLTRAFAADLTHIGAYRAWVEACRVDAEFAALDRRIRSWTLSRVHAVFEILQQSPGARDDIDVAALSRTMDAIFWGQLPDLALAKPARVEEFIRTIAHLIYHGIVADESPVGSGRKHQTRRVTGRAVRLRSIEKKAKAS